MKNHMIAKMATIIMRKLMLLPPAAACNTKFVMSLCYYFVELSIYLSIHSIILGIMPFIMYAYIIIYITYRNVGDVDGLSD